MTYIHQFHFLRPWWWLALIPLVIIILLYKAQSASDDSWAKVCDAHLLPYLLVDKFKAQSNKWLWALFSVWFITVFSLAGPTWRYQSQPVYQKNINRVIVMDLSANTLAADLPPSRLTRERYKLLDLLEKSNEGETGLVVYAGEPYTVSPLTSDSNTIAAMVDNLNPSIIPVQGNNLSSGLLLAKKLFNNAGQKQGQIIVISTGDVDKKADTTAADLARQGFKISVLGIGSTSNAPLKDGNGSFLHDNKGNIKFSRYDASDLMSIANAGDGVYVPFTNDNQDVNRLLQFDNTGSFKQTKHSAEETKMWRDEGHWFILLLLPMILLGFRKRFIERLTG